MVTVLEPEPLGLGLGKDRDVFWKNCRVRIQALPCTTYNGRKEVRVLFWFSQWTTNPRIVNRSPLFDPVNHPNLHLFCLFFSPIHSWTITSLIKCHTWKSRARFDWQWEHYSVTFTDLTFFSGVITLFQSKLKQSMLLSSYLLPPWGSFMM